MAHPVGIKIIAQSMKTRNVKIKIQGKLAGEGVH